LNQKAFETCGQAAFFRRRRSAAEFQATAGAEIKDSVSIKIKD
jgi:hypothetical protein